MKRNILKPVPQVAALLRNTKKAINLKENLQLNLQTATEDTKKNIITIKIKFLISCRSIVKAIIKITNIVEI